MGRAAGGRAGPARPTRLTCFSPALTRWPARMSLPTVTLPKPGEESPQTLAWQHLCPCCKEGIPEAVQGQPWLTRTHRQDPLLMASPQFRHAWHSQQLQAGGFCTEPTTDPGDLSMG